MLFSSFFQQDQENANDKARKLTDDILNRLEKTLGGKVLYGWVGQQSFDENGQPLPFPKYYRRTFSHEPKSMLNDKKGKRFVVWHDRSLRSTKSVAKQFVARLEETARTSPDAAVRSQAERTLVALQKDMQIEKLNHVRLNTQNSDVRAAAEEALAILRAKPKAPELEGIPQDIATAAGEVLKAA